MRVWAAGLISWMGTHWGCVFLLAVLTLAYWSRRRQLKQVTLEHWRERRMREELEAYAQLDASTAHDLSVGADPVEAGKAMARRVCRTVAEKSIFPRVAMLLRNAEGRFVCMGWVGVDDLTVAALHGWAESVVEDERGGAPRAIRSGTRSFPINLGEWQQFDREVDSWAMAGRKERRRWRRGIVAPLYTGGIKGPGKMMGALVVCSDGRGLEAWGLALDKAMGPIESLAARLGAAMENELMADRLLRAEKLAGLGQLAGGVAHALNNPLTAVLGFAELLADTASEARVRKDAATIAAEARKMKETVQRLVEFWRPVTSADEPVEIGSLLAELAGACEAKLRERGVLLEVLGIDTVPPLVRGSRDRLRQLMEHLLNNSAQAIAAAHVVPEEETHAIRLTVSHDERSLHVIVSDTGTGFQEPGRVFDPFYTTRGPESGAGLGLSICYGIVREHHGEITAFNLHPRGAAVVVELPLRKAMREIASNVVVMEHAKAS
jgi:signal transduction histidine kinase